MSQEHTPETQDERAGHDPQKVSDWVKKYGPGAQGRQTSKWIMEHGGADERRLTGAERDFWIYHLRAEGITDLKESLARAQAMGLKEEAARLQEQYDEKMKLAGESFEARKNKLLAEVESALKKLREEVHHEEGEWKHDTAWVGDLNDASFEYLSRTLDKPVMISGDLEVDYEVGPDMAFIVLEVQDPSTWIILREDGQVEYLTDEKIARVRPAKPTA